VKNGATTRTSRRLRQRPGLERDEVRQRVGDDQREDRGQPGVHERPQNCGQYSAQRLGVVRELEARAVARRRGCAGAAASCSEVANSVTSGTTKKTASHPGRAAAAGTACCARFFGCADRRAGDRRLAPGVRTPAGHPPPRGATAAGRRVPTRGARLRPPPLTSSGLQSRPSSRFDWPRKLATNAVRAFVDLLGGPSARSARRS
jgi:hypothetical protein